MFKTLKNKKATQLTEKNIEQYVKDEYGSKVLLKKNVCIENFIPLLQKDYGEKGDCTLTCITAVIHFITKNLNYINYIYDGVEKIAKKHLYNGSRGTPYITIRTIFNKSVSKYSSKKANVAYGKNLGYKSNDIIKQINKNMPVILSMVNDGRGYYKNHSVTIVGYKEFQVSQKKITMLKVYDNWSKEHSYVDYNKLSFISTIHYLVA